MDTRSTRGSVTLISEQYVRWTSISFVYGDKNGTRCDKIVTTCLFHAPLIIQSDLNIHKVVLKCLEYLDRPKMTRKIITDLLNLFSWIFEYLDEFLLLEISQLKLVGAQP